MHEASSKQHQRLWLALASLWLLRLADSIRVVKRGDAAKAQRLGNPRCSSGQLCGRYEAEVCNVGRYCNSVGYCVGYHEGYQVKWSNNYGNVCPPPAPTFAPSPAGWRFVVSPASGSQPAPSCHHSNYNPICSASNEGKAYFFDHIYVGGGDTRSISDCRHGWVNRRLTTVLKKYTCLPVADSWKFVEKSLPPQSQAQPHCRLKDYHPMCSKANEGKAYFANNHDAIGGDVNSLSNCMGGWLHHGTKSVHKKFTCTRISVPVAFSHDGHCAAGWLGPNAQVSSLAACANRCLDRGDCGHFSYAARGGPDGRNCALYSASRGCPADGLYREYKSYDLRKHGICEHEAGGRCGPEVGAVCNVGRYCKHGTLCVDNPWLANYHWSNNKGGVCSRPIASPPVRPSWACGRMALPNGIKMFGCSGLGYAALDVPLPEGDPWLCGEYYSSDPIGFAWGCIGSGPWPGSALGPEYGPDAPGMYNETGRYNEYGFDHAMERVTKNSFCRSADGRYGGYCKKRVTTAESCFDIKIGGTKAIEFHKGICYLFRLSGRRPDCPGGYEAKQGSDGKDVMKYVRGHVLQTGPHCYIA